MKNIINLFNIKKDEIKCKIKYRIGRIILFLCGVITLISLPSNLTAKTFADENYDEMENVLIMSGGNKIEKTKITLMRPCIVHREKIVDNTNEQNTEDDVKKVENLTNGEKYVKNLEEKIDEIDNLLESIDKKRIDNEKITFEYYSGKNEKVLDSLYSKIINNLNITKLYDVGYSKNSCRDMTKFFEKHNDSLNEMSDYIFSEDLDYNDYVLTTELEVLNENEIKVQLFLWDILDEKFLDGKYYILKLNNENNSYRLANIISDFIFKITTGESKGLFDSKIIYVAETGGPLKRERQIAMMNFDGTKNTKITNNKNLKLIPIFSKTNPNEIFYMEYLPDGAFIVKHELTTGRITKILAKNQNMTSAASFNPNGKNQLVLAGTNGRETNLFLFDFKTKKNRQLTDNNSINTAPSFNPEGNKIVYVSDKSGSRKLYIQDLETNKETLLTKENGVYDKPAWSPDGKLIAFIKLKGGQFQLGIMTYTGEAERILTSSYLIEGVKWSPNSRYLIYTKQNGAYGNDSIPKIYIKDILTGVEYKIQTPKQEGASDPDWIMNN